MCEGQWYFVLSPDCVWECGGLGVCSFLLPLSAVRLPSPQPGSLIVTGRARGATTPGRMKSDGVMHGGGVGPGPDEMIALDVPVQALVQLASPLPFVLTF
jgi:hypothetical protein